MVQTANHIVVEASKAANTFFLEPAELYVRGTEMLGFFHPKKNIQKLKNSHRATGWPHQTPNEKSSFTGELDFETRSVIS